MLSPPALLSPPQAGLLRANCAYVVECDRIWSLKQIGAIGPLEVERLFARAGYARGQAVTLAAVQERLIPTSELGTWPRVVTGA